MIGGPLEDTTGPALNNFIKFVAVFAFVTEGLYLPEPSTTWHLGFASVGGSLFLVAVSRFGLTLALNCITSFLKQRQLQQAYDDAEEEESDEEYEEEEDGEEGEGDAALMDG